MIPRNPGRGSSRIAGLASRVGHAQIGGTATPSSSNARCPRSLRRRRLMHHHPGSLRGQLCRVCRVFMHISARLQVPMQRRQHQVTRASAAGTKELGPSLHLPNVNRVRFARFVTAGAISPVIALRMIQPGPPSPRPGTRAAIRVGKEVRAAKGANRAKVVRARANLPRSREERPAAGRGLPRLRRAPPFHHRPRHLCCLPLHLLRM